MPVLAQNFVTMESDANAMRSALVADVLRGNGCLRQSVRLRVHGESMLPALWPGDVVEIENCSLEDIQPGEIVLALRDGRLFLHRLVQRNFAASGEPDGFVLRGDSVPSPDPLFPVSSLLGRLATRNTGGRSGPGFSAKWPRALGMIFCYCGVARRIALMLHSRKAPARDLQNSESTVEAGDL
jgi:hypothetical protein